MATFECRLSTTRGLLNKLLIVWLLLLLLLTRRWRITIVSGRSADHYAGRRESIIVQSATWSSVGARSVRRRQHARTHCGQGATTLPSFCSSSSHHTPLPLTYTQGELFGEAAAILLVRDNFTSASAVEACAVDEVSVFFLLKFFKHRPGLAAMFYRVQVYCYFCFFSITIIHSFFYSFFFFF